jgi:hypothetical protein
MFGFGRIAGTGRGKEGGKSQQSTLDMASIQSLADRMPEIMRQPMKTELPPGVGEQIQNLMADYQSRPKEEDWRDSDPFHQRMMKDRKYQNQSGEWSQGR